MTSNRWRSGFVGVECGGGWGMPIADHFIGGNFRFIRRVGYFVRNLFTL